MSLSFQCCFCEKGIEASEESDAVVLNAFSLEKWKRGKHTEGQFFYAHAPRLIANCRTSYPWELEAITGKADE